jgi:hypothetical protein
MTIYNTPVMIYHKVMEDNSLLSLTNYKKTNHKSKRFITLRERYYLSTLDKFNCQMIDEFGVNTDVEQIFYKRNTINRCKIKQILNDNNEHETLIQILESEIALLRNRIQEKGIKDTRKHNARLRRMIEERYHRNTKELTIFEFYNDLNDLKEESRETAETSKRRKVVNG